MAEVRFNQPVDMTSMDVTYGKLTDHTSSLIELTAGDIVFRYTGSFTYDSWGNVYGQLRGYTVTVAGRLATSISDFSVDAYRFVQELADEDVQAIYRMVLSRGDAFYGSVGRDTIISLSGPDKIRSAGGRDDVRAGTGDDRVWGGAGGDRLHGDGGNDRLSGDAGADRLFGDDGRDLLVGGAGRDRLDGGAGNDRLKGGAGGDTIVFAEKAGRDIVLDFDASEGDRVRLDRDLWDGPLSAAEIVEDFAKVNARGHAVLKFDDGERLVLKNFGDLGYLEDHILMFG